VSAPAFLADAIARCVDELAPGAVGALAEGLRAGRSRDRLVEVVPSEHYRAVVRELVGAWSASEDTSAEALALALESSTAAARLANQTALSVVWSGPPTEAVPVRRTDQVLLQLIRGSRVRLVIVSFVVTRIDAIAAAVVDAASRGVDVTLILESETEGGRAGFEGAGRLATEIARHARLYTWPAERRPRDRRGGLAALHAKVAVADGSVLVVSSANLTESAMERNMELGLLVGGGGLPMRVQTHFDCLIERGELQAVRAP
jgi:phosphatidylserine/phosphatidylglycerophosphate/cardiolipin synthase-like enzyme